MRRGPGVFLVAALLLGLGVAGLFSYRHHRSPRFALTQMATALTTRNYERFYDFLDISAIAAHLAAEGGQELFSSLREGDSLPPLGRKMGDKVARYLLPKLVGTFEGNLRHLLKQYLESLSLKELVGIAEVLKSGAVEQTGAQALVSLHLPHREARLRLSMAWDDARGQWRVVAINYTDLKELLRKELY